MMDVSDGLLIDAARMAEASGVSLSIELSAVPLSADYVATCGDTQRARIDAAIAGDDYELIFAVPAAGAEAVEKTAAEIGVPLTKIGTVEGGRGIRLLDEGREVPLPASLGWQHDAD